MRTVDGVDFVLAGQRTSVNGAQGASTAAGWPEAGRKLRCRWHRRTEPEYIGRTGCKAMSANQRLAKWAGTGCCAEIMTRGVAAGQQLHSEAEVQDDVELEIQMEDKWSLSSRKENWLEEVDSVWWALSKRDRVMILQIYILRKRSCAHEEPSWGSYIMQNVFASVTEMNGIWLTPGNVWLLCCRNIPAGWVERTDGDSREERTRASWRQGKKSGDGNTCRIDGQRVYGSLCSLEEVGGREQVRRSTSGRSSCHVVLDRLAGEGNNRKPRGEGSGSHCVGAQEGVRPLTGQRHGWAGGGSGKEEAGTQAKKKEAAEEGGSSEDCL